MKMDQWDKEMEYQQDQLKVKWALKVLPHVF